MFNEHGEFTLAIRRNPNLILLDVIEPFNIELFDRYHYEMQVLVDEFGGEPWYHVGVLKGETLLIPDVVEPALAHLAWRKERGIISDTIVLTENLAPTMVEQQLTEMFATKGIPLTFAPSLEQAMTKLPR